MTNTYYPFIPIETKEEAETLQIAIMDLYKDRTHQKDAHCWFRWSEGGGYIDENNQLKPAGEWVLNSSLLPMGMKGATLQEIYDHVKVYDFMKTRRW